MLLTICLTVSSFYFLKCYLRIVSNMSLSNSKTIQSVLHKPVKACFSPFDILSKDPMSSPAWTYLIFSAYLSHITFKEGSISYVSNSSES